VLVKHLEPGGPGDAGGDRPFGKCSFDRDFGRGARAQTLATKELRELPITEPFGPSALPSMGELRLQDLDGVAASPGTGRGLSARLLGSHFWGHRTRGATWKRMPAAAKRLSVERERQGAGAVLTRSPRRASTRFPLGEHTMPC
jgi:hypothetical protein